MRGSDLVVPIGADQQEMSHARLSGEMFQQVESCSVQPLKVVEEQHERSLRSSKHADKLTERPVEAIPRILRREVGNGWLTPNDDLELRDQVDDELSVRAQGLLKLVPPAADLRIALAKDLTQETLESLR